MRRAGEVRCVRRRWLHGSIGLDRPSSKDVQWAILRRYCNDVGVLRGKSGRLVTHVFWSFKDVNTRIWLS